MRKIKKGDTVIVMRGKDAGKSGEVIDVKEVLKKKVLNTKVRIKGVNIGRRYQKPNQQFNIEGGMFDEERLMNISNVMFSEDGKPVRLGFKIDEKTGKKVRFSKKSGKNI
jgi:large subunit ribosomal protein L24